MPTLLVVDDDEKTVEMVQELMELEGFEVLPATSPEEALQVLDAHPGSIDLLITDVVMPGTSGYVLSEQVKRRRPEIRVLFMSGFVVVPAHYGRASGRPAPSAPRHVSPRSAPGRRSAPPAPPSPLPAGSRRELPGPLRSYLPAAPRTASLTPLYHRRDV